MASLRKPHWLAKHLEAVDTARAPPFATTPTLPREQDTGKRAGWQACVLRTPRAQGHKACRMPAMGLGAVTRAGRAWQGHCSSSKRRAVRTCRPSSQDQHGPNTSSSCSAASLTVPMPLQCLHLCRLHVPVPVTVACVRASMVHVPASLCIPPLPFDACPFKIVNYYARARACVFACACAYARVRVLGSDQWCCAAMAMHSGRHAGVPLRSHAGACTGQGRLVRSPAEPAVVLQPVGCVS